MLQPVCFGTRFCSTDFLRFILVQSQAWIHLGTFSKPSSLLRKVSFLLSRLSSQDCKCHRPRKDHLMMPHFFAAWFRIFFLHLFFRHLPLPLPHFLLRCLHRLNHCLHCKHPWSRVYPRRLFRQIGVWTSWHRIVFSFGWNYLCWTDRWCCRNHIHFWHLQAWK